MPAETTPDVKEAILAQHRATGSSSRTIAALLGKRGIRVSHETVAQVVRAAKDPASGRAPAKTKPTKRRPSSPSQAPAQEPEPAALEAQAKTDRARAVAEGALPPVEDTRPIDPRLAVVELLDAGYARLLQLLEALDTRLAAEVAEPSPDWTFIAKARAELRHIRQDAILFKPTEEGRPEEDPHNAEAARVLCADLQARVEARRARPAA